MAAEPNNSHNNNRYYWMPLMALLIFSLAGSITGFREYFMAHGESHDWLRCLYRTLQLFTFEGGDFEFSIPWQLDASRFTAPLTTVLTFVYAMLEIFKERWTRMRMRRLRHHVVIIGLGTKGKNLLRESLQKKEKVLVIEKNPLNPNLASLKSSGGFLLIGDAKSTHLLNKAKITHAKSVFLLMQDDNDQVNTCLRIYQLLKESHRGASNALNCLMHLRNQEFLNPMRSHNLVRDVHDGFILNIFNVYENSARVMFDEHPPDRSGITIDSKKYVQIIIIGFGQAGEALALQTAYNGHYINGKKPQVLVVDLKAREKIPDFLERYPTYTDYCDIRLLEHNANSPQFLQHLSQNLDNHPDALNTIILCFDNKTHNMLLSLQLENLMIDGTYGPLNIFARTSDNESFASFSQNIKPYGLPSKVSSFPAIIEEDLDKKAKAIHRNYLEKRKNEPDFGTRAADAPWKNLSQEYKDSNRKVGDHLGVKMRGIGCEIVSQDDLRPAAIFSPEELYNLSKLEHRRWCADRSLAGWTYGKEKNEKTRRTPYLTDWENLSEEIRDYDSNVVRNIPEILSTVGLKAVRIH